MRIQVRVVGPQGDEKLIDVCSSEEELGKITIQQLIVKIMKEFVIDDEIRVVFGKDKLEDKNTLSSCGIRHMSTLHTMLKMHGGL